MNQYNTTRPTTVPCSLKSTKMRLRRFFLDGTIFFASELDRVGMSNSLFQDQAYISAYISSLGQEPVGCGPFGGFRGRAAVLQTCDNDNRAGCAG
jgi:hypothetical protein